MNIIKRYKIPTSLFVGTSAGFILYSGSGGKLCADKIRCIHIGGLVGLTTFLWTINPKPKQVTTIILFLICVIILSETFNPGFLSNKIVHYNYYNPIFMFDRKIDELREREMKTGESPCDSFKKEFFY